MLNPTDIKIIILNSIFAFLCLSTTTFSCNIFVESEIISKHYTFIIGSILFCLVTLFSIKKTTIYIDSATISICIFIFILLTRIFFSSTITNNTYTLLIIAFIILYFSLKITLRLYPHYLKSDIIIIFSCITQAIYGLTQYIGLLQTNSIFPIIGSFDNPAGFAACLAAGFPFCLLFIQKSGWKFYLGITSAFIIGLNIILSGSRAGIIAITSISIIYLGTQYHKQLKKYYKYISFTFIILIVGLFLFKKDSALGRILIWNNSFDMILEKPILGHGANTFMSHYMLYQANYFNKNPNNRYVELADNILHPFNEYILLSVEYGIIELLLISIIAIIIIKSTKQINTFHLCLLSIGIFACFSYPLRYPFTMILLAHSLANLKTKTIFISHLKFSGKIIILIILIFLCTFSFRDIKFEKEWKILTRQTITKNSKTLLSEYARLYSDWNGNPMFLYNYGAVLNMSKKYKSSNNVMIKCTKYLNDYDVQMLIADNYYNMKQWNMANKHYIIANHMIPNRFMPLYKRMLLYTATGNEYSAFCIAQIIINKPVKIPSGTINKIKAEARKVIDRVRQEESYMEL